MKKLYEFTVAKVENVVEKETTTNEKGDKVTTEKTVEKTVKHDFFLRKPTRALYDEAELFYGIELSKGIKAGLLTKALLAKRYENDGGALSDGEIERYGNLYLDFYRNTDEYQRLLMKADADMSDEDREKMQELEKLLQDTRSSLTQFEMEQQSLYEQTAEVRARNKTILWWILYLSYNDSGSYFPGKTFEDRLATYDELSEAEDIFINTVIQRLTYFVSFWFVGRASNQDEFDEMIREQGLFDETIDGTSEEIIDEEIIDEDIEKESEIILEKVEEEPAEEKKPAKKAVKKRKQKAPKKESENNPEKKDGEKETAEK